MSIKVLIVDDSQFFRRRIGEIVDNAAGLEVIDFAVDGRQGVEKTIALRPDVVMMDIEMPVKNGIDATREIMNKCPTPILMFSSLTHDGAKATLDALEAGAADFLPKKFEEIAGSSNVAAKLIEARIHAIAGRRRTSARTSTTPARTTTAALGREPMASPRNRLEPSPRQTAPVRARTKTETQPVQRSVRALDNDTVTKASGKRYNLLAIASSTGGPVALQAVLTKLPANFPVPILLVQHMPSAFTKAFAERLDRLCKIGVKEAENGDTIKPGNAYLAPGGMQMLLERGNRLKVTPGPDTLNYKPSADVSFATIAKSQDGNTLVLVLTGMGADGCDGAKLLKAKGATVWAQDEASSVVYGMPQAVKKAGLTDKVLSIDNIGSGLVKEICHG